MTSKASGVFCARVAEARAKIEAARERDRLDVQIAALPAPKVLAAPGAEAPVVDPYVANVLAISKELGFRPSERLVKAEEAISRALGFELLAALGPTCWLAFVNMLAAGGAAAARVRKGPTKPDASKATAVGGAPALLGNADDHDRCIADLFETESAGVMAAKEIRPFVQAWFSARGLKLNEAKLWSKMGERFKRAQIRGDRDTSD